MPKQNIYSDIVNQNGFYKIVCHMKMSHQLSISTSKRNDEAMSLT